MIDGKASLAKNSCFMAFPMYWPCLSFKGHIFWESIMLLFVQILFDSSLSISHWLFTYLCWNIVWGSFLDWYSYHISWDVFKESNRTFAKSCSHWRPIVSLVVVQCWVGKLMWLWGIGVFFWCTYFSKCVTRLLRFLWCLHVLLLCTVGHLNPSIWHLQGQLYRASWNIKS